MSLIKANSVQIGQSTTATNNFVWYQPTVPDGTIRLANGNSGSSTDILTINSSGNATFIGSVVASGTSTSSADLKLYEDTDNGTNYVALKAPDSIASNVTWTLPSADGTSGQYLRTNGSGTLSFATIDLSTISGGTLNVSGSNAAGATVRFYEDTDNGTNYVALKAPDTISADLIFTLPATTGTNGQTLITNGSGTLSFANILPTQTGNSGRYLTTNGTTASWGVITSGITASDDTTTNASYYPSLFTATSGTQSSAVVSSTKLYFNPSTGTLNATVFNSLSDVTQKTNVVKIQSATNTLGKINGVEFDWIDNDNHSAGVIAQQLETILPFLVETNETGIKSVNYSGLIAYLIESNKELAARVEALENK